MPASLTPRPSSNALHGLLLLGVLLVAAGCAAAQVLQPGGHGQAFDPSPTVLSGASQSVGPTGIPLASSSSSNPTLAPPTLAPGEHQIALGISTPDSLADKDSREGEVIQALDRLAAPVAEGGMGRYPGAFPFWTDFAEYRGPYTARASFPTTTMLDALDARGITPMVYLAPVGPGIDRTPNNTIERAIPYSNASIAAGSFDDFLRTWAEAAAAYGKTVVLRYAWEMNGSWFPWSPTQDRTRYFDLGNTPANYRLAWRHVYSVIHEIAPNVKFFWCPTVTGIAGVGPYFPGAAYVDYVGVDGYARGAAQTMAAVLGPALARVHTLPGAFNLPLLVGETGVQAGLPDRGAWLTTGYEALYARFPQLAGIVYFDFNMTDVFGQRLENGNWQLESDPAALAAYSGLLADPRFQGTLSEPVPVVGPSPSASVPVPTLSPSLAPVLPSSGVSRLGSVAPSAEVP